MTLEELKAKKVHILVDKTFILGEDLDEDILIDLLEDQKTEEHSDKDVFDIIIDNYYINDFMDDILEYSDYKITIE